MNAEKYLEYVNSPWGQLFYELVCHHLNFSGKNILDFGSGFGITANKLAENNNVIAVEPDKRLLTHRRTDNKYVQLCGSIEALKDINSNSFDVIICHNVLEYIEFRKELINEFYRLLKPKEILSVVKHNKLGKVMQKAVFEYNPEQSMALLRGENTESANFGQINEYTEDDLVGYCQNKFAIKGLYGIRTFYGLQSNDIKYNEAWKKNMFELECAAESVHELRNIAFFHHVILEKE